MRIWLVRIRFVRIRRDRLHCLAHARILVCLARRRTPRSRAPRRAIGRRFFVRLCRGLSLRRRRALIGGGHSCFSAPRGSRAPAASPAHTHPSTPPVPAPHSPLWRPLVSQGERTEG